MHQVGAGDRSSASAWSPMRQPRPQSFAASADAAPAAVPKAQRILSRQARLHMLLALAVTPALSRVARWLASQHIAECGKQVIPGDAQPGGQRTGYVIKLL